MVCFQKKRIVGALKAGIVAVELYGYFGFGEDRRPEIAPAVESHCVDDAVDMSQPFTASQEAGFLQSTQHVRVEDIDTICAQQAFGFRFPLAITLVRGVKDNCDSNVRMRTLLLDKSLCDNTDNIDFLYALCIETVEQKNRHYDVPPSAGNHPQRLGGYLVAEESLSTFGIVAVFRPARIVHEEADIILGNDEIRRTIVGAFELRLCVGPGLI